MPAIVMKQVYCPLCSNVMARREVMVGKKRATVFFCRPCAIGIYDFDPAFNKWRDADKNISCPHCGKDLNWFARYMDGYFKAVCRHCKTKMEKDGDVTFGKGGNIIIPDEMETDTDEPVRVEIPISKLKGLGRDQQNALRNKVRSRNKE